MRPSTTTTVVTYCVLLLAGTAPLAMPERLASPALPAVRRVGAENAGNTNVSGAGDWSGNGAASAISPTPYMPFD